MAAPATDTTDTMPAKQPDSTMERIAVALGETETQPLTHIARIVRTLGEERTMALLARAEAVEAQGGMTLPDGTRRTKGGVFFRLAREQTTPAERSRIWPWTRGPKPAAAERRRTER